MATRNEQVPDEIKLYVDNPKELTTELKPDDMISKHFNIDHIEEVVGENPYENAFPVDIDTNKVKTIGHLKDAIKEKLHPKFENVTANDIKLWKVDISLEKENKKLELVNTKINVNIKNELGGEELPPLSKISKHFPSQPADEHIHIIVQRPVETKE
ncbi:18663_t:CDS:2, partial [Funneliformis geosporum]